MADAGGWEDVLSTLGLEVYIDKLHGAGIDTPMVLVDMGHHDALAVLKELEVLPGHRHRILNASQGTSALATPSTRPLSLCIDATASQHAGATPMSEAPEAQEEPGMHRRAHQS